MTLQASRLRWHKLALLSCLLPVLTSAQVITSSLRGYVTDPSGASVSGAKVRITSVYTGFSREQFTTSEGHFVFTGIPAGVYDMVAEHAGFQTAARNGQTLTQQMDLRVDFELKVGSTQQTWKFQRLRPCCKPRAPRWQ